jgi:hypothetical protein
MQDTCVVQSCALALAEATVQPQSQAQATQAALGERDLFARARGGDLRQVVQSTILH